MKLYILVKDSIDIGLAMTAVAHASLVAHLQFHKDLEYQQWLNESFKKVVCKVNEKEFEKAKTFDNCVIITDSSLGHAEIAIVFKPRNEFPKPFKFYKLYS